MLWIFQQFQGFSLCFLQLELFFFLKKKEEKDDGNIAKTRGNSCGGQPTLSAIDMVER
jgi:hypothetical protein